MNLNPPNGMIEDIKPSKIIKDIQDQRDSNGLLMSQPHSTSSCLSNSILNADHTNTNTTTNTTTHAKEHKANENQCSSASKDANRAITYPFNWEQSFKKKMSNTELFLNKKTKPCPFKTTIEEMQKESFYPAEFLQWNKQHIEGKNEMKSKCDIKAQLTSATSGKVDSKRLDKSVMGNGMENDNEMTKESTECYLDLLIESANALINKGLKLNSLKDYNPTPITIDYSMGLNDKSINSTDYISRSPEENLKGKDKDKDRERDKLKERDSITSTGAVPTTASSITFLQRKCENKICPVTINKMSHIHQAKIGTLKNKMLNLCSQCYKAWKNGQYCYYCGVIYREYSGTKGFNESKMWVACEFCKNWEHLACEEQKGVYPDLSRLIKDSKFKYDCPLCRKKKKEREQIAALRREGDGKGMLLQQKSSKSIVNEDYYKMSNPVKKK